MSQTSNISIQDLQNYEKDKEYCFDIYKKISEFVSDCLLKQDYARLLTLQDFFNNIKQYPRFHHSAETRRISIMLLFLKFELEKGLPPFISTTKSYDEFMEQYLLTVFAMRRLEIGLSAESMEEANLFLSSVPFHVYTAIFLSEYELFSHYESLVFHIYVGRKESWSIPEQIHWLTHSLKRTASDRILTALSLLHMELQDFAHAYEYLQKISNPASETLSLIQILKEHLHHE